MGDQQAGQPQPQVVTSSGTSAAMATAAGTQQQPTRLRRAVYVHVSDLTSAYDIDHALLERELQRVKLEQEQQDQEQLEQLESRSRSPQQREELPVPGPTELQTHTSMSTGAQQHHPQKRLQPPRGGYNLCVLVGPVRVVVDKRRVDGSRVRLAEVQVGDETGVVSLRARDEQIDLLQQISNRRGAVVLRNCLLELYQGKHLRLAVTKWGKLQPYPDAVPSTPPPPSQRNPDRNFSRIDLSLVAKETPVTTAAPSVVVSTSSGASPPEASGGITITPPKPTMLLASMSASGRAGQPSQPQHHHQASRRESGASRSSGEPAYHQQQHYHHHHHGHGHSRGGPGSRSSSGAGRHSRGGGGVSQYGVVSPTMHGLVPMGTTGGWGQPNPVPYPTGSYDSGTPTGGTKSDAGTSQQQHLMLQHQYELQQRQLHHHHQHQHQQLLYQHHQQHHDDGRQQQSQAPATQLLPVVGSSPLLTGMQHLAAIAASEPHLHLHQHQGQQLQQHSNEPVSPRMNPQAATFAPSVYSSSSAGAHDHSQQQQQPLTYAAAAYAPSLGTPPTPQYPSSSSSSGFHTPRGKQHPHQQYHHHPQH